MTDDPIRGEARGDRVGPSQPSAPAAAGLRAAAAAALVFGSSAAVLVVELVALRLLAPYLGLTLETSTLVIGIALTAIALGSWLGGRAADVVAPRSALGPLLAVSGIATALTPIAVRGTAEAGGRGLLLLVAAAMILIPGALLSAVSPMVTKLRLTSLAETGTVVGRLSGIGTAGSIAGTVVTGFVLISAVSVTTILVGLGIALVACAALVELRVRGAWAAAIPIALVVGAGGLAVVAPGRCDVETAYHCASVVVDPDRPSGRVLVLDGLSHSYVDLEDPTYLEFRYIRAIAAVVDTAYPPSAAIDAYHLGGGGLTIPRYLDATRPGTRSLVSEIDSGVVDVERLGLRTGEGIDVRVEDGRLGVTALPDNTRDLIVGDAFGGVSVPWHLTTVEAMTQVRRVLTEDGLYVANLIDHDPLAFARAELATLAGVFDRLVLLAPPATLADDGGGGNLVVVASDAALDVDAVTSALAERDTGWAALTGDDLEDWIGDAPILTDDFAPVDHSSRPTARPGAELAVPLVQHVVHVRRRLGKRLRRLTLDFRSTSCDGSLPRPDLPNTRSGRAGSVADSVWAVPSARAGWL